MKPAAREARLPPRSPGLRWALPLLLLLLRLGQILCAGGTPSPIPDPSVATVATGENGITQISSTAESFHKQNGTGTTQVETNTSEDGESSGANDSLRTPEQGSNGTDGASQKTPSSTVPIPVSDLRVALTGVRKAALSWSNGNGTAS
ncbi:PTPRJ isoform 7, partial [Pan troglodytes]